MKNRHQCLKNTKIFFARAGRRFIEPRKIKQFGLRIEWVDTTRYLGVNLDRRLTWSPHIGQVRKIAAQRLGIVVPLLNRKSDLSVRNGGLIYKQLIRPLMDSACPRVEIRCPLSCPEVTGVTNQVSSPRYWCPLVLNQQEDKRGSGCSSVFRPHQSNDRELRLNFS